MLHFKWTLKRERAALALAQAFTTEKAAEVAGVTRMTIHRWRQNPEFAAEVDRLSLMVGIASKAERLRIVTQAIRQKIKEDGTFETKRDLLDWLKFAQSETDGAKLDLAVVFENLEAAAEEKSSTDED